MADVIGRVTLGWENCLVTMFDVRVPGVAERFHRERMAWREDADVEMLDLDHAILTIQPSGARRLAA